MRCPSCGEQTKKRRLDRYWCAACRKMWLIHQLTTYSAPEKPSTIKGVENVKGIEG